LADDAEKVAPSDSFNSGEEKESSLHLIKELEEETLRRGGLGVSRALIID